MTETTGQTRPTVSEAPQAAERIRELETALAEARKVFSCADDMDWDHLDILLGHSGHGKFWRAVFKDFRDWLSRNKESSE